MLVQKGLQSAAPSEGLTDLARTSPTYRILMALLLGVVAGSVTILITQQWRLGLGVTGLNNGAPWGMYIVNFIFFIGTSAGGILVASLVYAFGLKRFAPVGRLAELVALGSLLMAMIFILLDMGRPTRFFHLLIYGKGNSPLIWDFYIMFVYLAITLGLTYLSGRKDMVLVMQQLPGRKLLYKILTLGYTDISPRAVERDHRWLRVLATIAIPAAILLHSITAWLLGLVKAQPGWHNPMLAPLFVVSAAVSGVALVTLVTTLLRKRVRPQIPDELVTTLGRILMWLLPVLGYFLFAELLTVLYASEPGHLHIFQDMIAGRFAPIFWFDVVIGLLIPILLLIISGHRPVATGIAALMVLVGVYAERVLILLPSQLNREFPAQSVGYAPTSTEWMLVAGVWALGILIIMVVAKIFPLVPANEEAKTQ